jgi:hypothetical protein
MLSSTRSVVVTGAVIGYAFLPLFVATPTPPAAERTQGTAVTQRINLAEWLAAGKLRTGKLKVTPLAGRDGAIYIAERPDNGVAWVTGTDFGNGTIEVDVKGRDVFQQSFLGIAFHRKDEGTYESVYLRPFNFRSDDPARKQHAVQYMMVPEFDWPRLRKEFPEEFENPVDQSIVPTDWVSLRVVVKDKAVQIFVGPGTAPALETRKLGSLERGEIGLWTGNGSDGGFANLRISPMK